jgi:hypothetical protein
MAAYAAGAVVGGFAMLTFRPQRLLLTASPFSASAPS